MVDSDLVSAEELTPLVLATQQQFNFTHICAGASAFGKVTEDLGFTTVLFFFTRWLGLTWDQTE